MKFGIPLVFLTTGTLLLGLGDRYVLGLVKDLSEVGIYTLAYKVASVVNLFILQAVGLAVMPVALKSFNSESGRLLLTKIFTYLCVVLCLMFLLISVFSLDVLKIFVRRGEYLLADIIIPVLLFAYVFDGLRSMYNYHLIYLKKTVLVMVIILSSAAVNLGLNFLFIPKYSYMGAAVTTLITSFLTYLVFEITALKAIYVPYQQVKVLFSVGLSVLIFGLFKLFELGTIVGGLLIVAFIAILFITKVIDPHDFRKVQL
jgi:O-antigen/teichoic acid export membrane protein